MNMVNSISRTIATKLLTSKLSPSNFEKTSSDPNLPRQPNLAIIANVHKHQDKTKVLSSLFDPSEFLAKNSFSCRGPLRLDITTRIVFMSAFFQSHLAHVSNISKLDFKNTMHNHILNPRLPCSSVLMEINMTQVERQTKVFSKCIVDDLVGMHKFLCLL